MLTDLAKSLPSTCQFDGFDFSPDQFPPEKDLPNNVKLHIADAKVPMDTKFHRSFDVVIIRYLNAGMRPEDWMTVTRNIYDILKPKGWIQWIEVRLWHISPF